MYLQPRNIFLHGPDCHVKIGDFGLACQNIVMEEHEQLPSNSQTGVNTGETVCNLFYQENQEYCIQKNYNTYRKCLFGILLFLVFGKNTADLKGR